MSFLEKVLQVMDKQMETPELFGWFHVLWLLLTALGTVFLCVNYRNASEKQVRNIVFYTAVVVAVLEVYKQINYSFSYGNGIVFDYQWYAFPFQFCSTPMYIGLLAGVFPKGKIRDTLYAYLATYSVFAGLAVMIYPGDVFVGTIGINIQTMICHGSMIVIGAYLFYSGTVKIGWKTLVRGMIVFSITLGIAVVLNEIAFYAGLLETEVFNMFFVSRHCAPSLPVYSIVQGVVPYPWSLIIYILGFTAAAGVIVLLAAAVKGLSVSLSRTFGKNKLTA